MNTNPSAIKVLCFGDSNDYVVQEPDGAHWTKESRAKFGEALAQKIKEITE
jgi:hypothetical protein